MTKIFKNISIYLCGMFALLFAGIFFVGCQVDYSKISLSCDQQSVEIEVGESVDLTFTIENYVDGFSNKVQINPVFSGQANVFSCSDPIYLSNRKIKVTVTAVSGGQGQIRVSTIEAQKECTVSVSVTQYSKNLSFDNRVLYVSSETDFVPNSNLFNFDANTTNKEMSYYYLETIGNTEIDFNKYYLDSIDDVTKEGKFVNGAGADPIYAKLSKFDKVSLDKQLDGYHLILHDGETTNEKDLTKDFCLLSVYDHSIENAEDYDKIVYAVSTVNVLVGLDVSITGGYASTKIEDFTQIDGNVIKIVPNNSEKTEFILRVEMNGVETGSELDSPINVEVTSPSNKDYVDVDFKYYEEEEPLPEGRVVRYFKISQNAQTQAEMPFDLRIYYDVAKDIDDPSVNFKESFLAKIEVAPTAITVNGETAPDGQAISNKFVLYNYYKYPEFGWNELLIDVISGYESSPNFDGIYFTFDTEYIDIMYNGMTVESVADGQQPKVLYKDLGIPFYVRGKYGSKEVSNTVVTIHLKSDILQGKEELTIKFNSSIIAGAQALAMDEDFAEQAYIYVDYDAEQTLFEHIYADQAFQFYTIKLVNGYDVLGIESMTYADVWTGESRVYKYDDSHGVDDKRYYLGLNFTPKRTGVGKYRINLDNGMPIEFSVNCIKTLKAETTEIRLANEGNKSVTFESYSKTEDAKFNNILNLEVLNPSDKSTIKFGNEANIEIVSNASTIAWQTNHNLNYLSISPVTDEKYRITTLANGYTKIEFNLRGNLVENFNITNANLTVWAYVSSYSLVDEFYLKNGDGYALNNVVYYSADGGKLQTEDLSVAFTSVVNNKDSNNFFRYQFASEAIASFSNDAVYDVGENLYNYEVSSDQYITKLDYNTYSNKYMYFVATTKSGSPVAVSTEVNIAKQYYDNGTLKTDAKKIVLGSSNGLMFLSDNVGIDGGKNIVHDNMQYYKIYTEYDELGNEIATYYANFSNVYRVGGYGSFDVDALTFENGYGGGNYQISITAYLSQRDSSKEYEAKINSQRYKSVERISLASTLSSLSFTNDELTHTIGVYTYPTDSTNKNIRIQFVRTKDNPYSNMVTWDVSTAQQSNGIFTVTLSCEKFFNENKDKIVDIQESLTGKIYIYPAEWGDSYTSIDSNLDPICIDVQYENGSKTNPYTIDDAEDVVKINSNETTLKSHYRIRSVIDMSTVQNFIPIGILQNADGSYYLSGFSGSIVGENSQAAISNIAVSYGNGQDNFACSVGGVLYTGLFAQIKAVEGVSDTGKIENVTFSGKFNIGTNENARISLISAVNKGCLINVGAKIDSSNIEVSKKSYFGAVAAVNYGEILQDFRTYQEGGKYQGQMTKNLAYYNGTVNITGNNATVYAGGIAGASNGNIERILPTTNLKLYGYSAYSAYTKINFVGTATLSSQIYLGGAVGLISFGTVYLPEYKSLQDNNVMNLLVGGEISTKETLSSQYADYIGGIVGYADSLNNAGLNVFENISRVFVRGVDHVGGIIGYDRVDTYGNKTNLTYIKTTDAGDVQTTNKIEAVDDGRNSFESAMIIKYKNLQEEVTMGQISADKNAYFAIGNAVKNNRSYEDIFEVYSYLNRSSISLPDEATNLGAEVVSSSKVTTNNSSTDDYYADFLSVSVDSSTTAILHKALKFEHKEVELDLDASKNEYRMTSSDENVDIFFMYYFSVTGKLSGNVGSSAQDEIEELNVIKTSSVLYPFAINNQDVSISSANTNLLSIDVNGNMTVKGTGLATITVNSLLNVMKSRVIYVYIVNYFDKDAQGSLFYTSANLNGINISNGSNVMIYGNSSTSLNVVPSYSLNEIYIDGENVFGISRDGILNYKNTNFVLEKNSQMTIDYSPKTGMGSYFSAIQVNKQVVIFLKKEAASPDDGTTDAYSLIPIFKVTVQVADNDGKVNEVDCYYELSASKIDIGVKYRETATSIRTNYKFHAMQTNNVFSDTVTIQSTNPEELLFYEIVRIVDGDEEIVQQRMPTAGQLTGMGSGSISWSDYINYLGDFAIDADEQLFDINFQRDANQTNVFNFTCEVYTEGSKFANRFKENIFGEYVVRLYASELKNSDVSYAFTILLDEADINYISISNYSNINDLSASDELVVPNRTGLLEITLDPVEAVFDTIIVKNNALNDSNGAALAELMFAYEKISGTGVEYVVSTSNNFAKYDDKTASLKFTYQGMKDYFAELNENEEGFSVEYVGKIFIAYEMPSRNVEDGVSVGFDFSVTYGNEGESKIDSTILLKTKLDNYAKLMFNDRANSNGIYYVARGLSYDLSLEYYGFEIEDIKISSSREDFATITGSGTNRVLQITKNPVQDNSGAAGYMLEIETRVELEEGDPYINTLKICIMEYVLNYTYQEGVFEDIVKGMENGSIYTAIGNPYALQLDITNFLEYDASNEAVVKEVQLFVESMTSNMDWTVYLEGEATKLEAGKQIDSHYYKINGLTVTPIRIYRPENDIYHFSAEANYIMKNGIYIYTDSKFDTNRLYTEFSFEVHEQSTEESPLPIETYEDFMKMQEGQWYILLNDIELPSAESAAAKGIDEFKPITEKIAGFDGNDCRLFMSGNYNFADLNAAGVFAEVSDETIIKNLTISLTNDVVFKMNASTFEIGILAAKNEGIITNCETEILNSSTTLSVVCSSAPQTAYVAGLVGQNGGYITNSRSEVNILGYTNISGFVGQNSGIISSSYFLGGRLKNETTATSEYTAGFVITNSGKIYTSYTSGAVNSSEMYFTGSNSETGDFIQSTNNIAGFVYTNSGDIEDCYSNVQLKQSGAFAAGFVYENSGYVARCFSTSLLESNHVSNYGFALRNNAGSTPGTIEDCLFLQDKNNEINVSIGEIVLDEKTDVEALTVDEFKFTNGKNPYFENYVVANGRNMNSVWFYNDENVTVDSNFAGVLFNKNRIELVAPNIVAHSSRELDRIETITDELTGASYANYIYVYKEGSYALGTAYNPIVVDSAESLEDYMSNETNSAGYNYSYYRLVSDIDYSEYADNSVLYKTKFMGYLEGNFMSITGISLISSDSITSAGLFAEVGKSSLNNAIGTIMNFSLTPSTVSFANANVVGAITGRVDGGTVINVEALLSSNNRLLVVGNNIVGGAIGLAVGNYKVQNVYSQLGAKARNQDTNIANKFTSTNANYSIYSFAGSFVGVLSGKGTVYNCETDSVVSVLGSKAGIMFGLIDKDATVEKVRLEMKENMLVNAYTYGGLVAGESAGTVKNVDIIGLTDGSDSYFKNFMRVPFIPDAVGGYAGIVSGGIIENITMTQDIEVGTASSDTGIKSVGGIAGEITGVVTMKNVYVEADFVGFRNVGGVVGTIDCENKVANFIDVNVKSAITTHGMKVESSGVGGLAGEVTAKSMVSLTSSTASDNEKLDTKKLALKEKEQELAIETDPSEINRLEEEIASLNNQIAGLEAKIKTNTFEVSATSQFYIYNTEINILYGGIIGANYSEVTHAIYDTYSSIEGSATIYEITIGNYTEVSPSLKVVTDNTGVSTLKNDVVKNSDGEDETVIKTNIGLSERSSYYCDIKFTRPHPEAYAEKSCDLFVNLFGSPIAKKAA